MNKVAQHALLAIVLSVGALLTAAWAQTPERTSPLPAAALPSGQGPVPPVVDPMRPKVHPRSGFMYGGAPGRGGMMGAGIGGVGRGRGRGPFPHPMSEEEVQEFEALQQAVDKLKSAKADGEKTAATKEVSELLEKSFQRDLERREKQIVEVEARVKKLRDQIEKRKKAKDEIISLRLKTIVNEADGLGFPGPFEQEPDLNPLNPPAGGFGGPGLKPSVDGRDGGNGRQIPRFSVQPTEAIPVPWGLPEQETP